MRFDSNDDVTLSSSAIWGAAGATMDDADADIIVYKETIATTSHFCRSGQFCGLDGEVCQVYMLLAEFKDCSTYF